MMTVFFLPSVSIEHPPTSPPHLPIHTKHSSYFLPGSHFSLTRQGLPRLQSSDDCCIIYGTMYVYHTLNQPPHITGCPLYCLSMIYPVLVFWPLYVNVLLFVLLCPWQASPVQLRFIAVLQNVSIKHKEIRADKISCEAHVQYKSAWIMWCTAEVGSLHTLRLESIKLVFQTLHKFLVNKL